MPIHTTAAMTMCTTVYASQLNHITQDNDNDPIRQSSTPKTMMTMTTTTADVPQTSTAASSSYRAYTISEGMKRKEASTTSMPDLKHNKDQGKKQQKDVSEEHAGKGVHSKPKTTNTAGRK